MISFTNTQKKILEKAQVFGILFAVFLLAGCGNSAVSQDTTPDTASAPTQQTQQQVATVLPPNGWTIHMTAKKLFPGNPDTTVNKYCKSVAGNMTECQLYDGNTSDSRLVGVETMVDAQIYNNFPP